MIVDQKINKEFVGAFLIDGDMSGTKLAVSKKPNMVRRFFMFLLLGWKWVELHDMKQKK